MSLHPSTLPLVPGPPVMKVASSLPPALHPRVIPYTLKRGVATTTTATTVSPSTLLPSSRDPSLLSYPTTLASRQAYLDPHTAKPLTPFQWKVYDLAFKVTLILLSCRAFGRAR